MINSVWSICRVARVYEVYGFVKAYMWIYLGYGVKAIYGACSALYDDISFFVAI